MTAAAHPHRRASDYTAAASNRGGGDRHFQSWVEAVTVFLFTVATVALVAGAVLMGMLFTEQQERRVENLRAICLAEKQLGERPMESPCPTLDR